MATINGTNFLLKRQSDGQVVGHSKSISLTIGADLPESTNKDSNGFQEVIAGLRNAQLSVSGLTRYGDPLNYTELADYVLQRTEVEFYIEKDNGLVFMGNGNVSDATETGAFETATEFDAEILIKQLFLVSNPNISRIVWALNGLGTWDDADELWQNA
jgi:predicted secreted protein